MQIFKERAENFSLDELKSLNLSNNRLLFHLTDYFKNETHRPMLLVGNQGSGKTVNTMQALSDNVHMDESSLPVMFVYQQRKKLEPLDPLKLATQETWGQRYQSLQSNDREELMKKASIVVHDDVHFEFQDVARGKVRIEDVVSELRELSKESEKGKKVLLISEDPLTYYQEKLSRKMNTEDLDEVLLKFGQLPCYRFGKDRSKWCEYEEKANILSFREVPSLSRVDWEQLFRVYNADAEGHIRSFIYESNSQPRAFVKMAKLFQEKEDETIDITTNKFVRKAVDLLPSNVRNRSELKQDYYLLNFPTIPISESNAWGYSTYEENQSSANNKIKSFIRGRDETIIQAYQHFPAIKVLCRGFLQTKGIDKKDVTFDDICFASESLNDVNRYVEGLKVDTRTFMEVVKNPSIFNFLQTIDILNRHEENAKLKEQILRNEVLNSSISLFNELKDERYEKSKNYFIPSFFKKYVDSQGYTHWSFEKADYLFLKRPFQVAFRDQLYEVPTLEVLDEFL